MRLWHNPRCSKSRAALALLEEAGVSVEVYHYLEAPLDEGALDTVLDKLGIAAAELTRTCEPSWRESALAKDSPDPDIRAAILAHPILVERPIFETESRAVIGRPPARVLELL
ncbi:MAG: arsenate reductase (glutaredoxin) [Pseudomonadota bacterium]